MKTAECVEPGEKSPEPSESAIVATVTWRGTDHVRLEVTLRPSHQMVTRDIDFGPHDAVEERWRTTGLVVGTLASVLARNELPSAGELPEVPEPERPPAPSPEEPEPELSAPPPQSNARDTLLQPPHFHGRPPAPPWRLFVDAAGFVAPAVVGGPYRAGGDLGLRLRAAALPVEPAADVEYSESLADLSGVRIRIVDAFLGFAVSGNLGGPFSSVARGEGFFRWLEASAEPVGALGPTEKARVLGGARVGLDGMARIVDRFSVFVGAAGIFAAGSTDVRARSQSVGSVPALSYELRAGITLGL